MAMSKKLTHQSFQNLYPAPTEDFSHQMTDMLQRLPDQQRESSFRKKRSAGLVLAFALMLTAFSALAAALDWNVLDFLFGNQDHDAKALVQYVNIHSSDGQVTLTVNSAITDGEIIAMDWTIVNDKPDIPVYIMVDEFTINGEHVSTDGNDEFDSCWLPGPFGKDGKMQNGELIRLPEAIRAGDMLDVVLRAKVYYSELPIYVMDAYDEALAEEKIREGYLVVPEGEGYVNQDADGIYWAAGPNPANMSKHFTHTDLEIAFALSPEIGRASTRQLQTQAQYETERYAARYAKAEVSPLGLTLHLEFDAPDAAYSFELTDEQGNLMDVKRVFSEYETTSAANGHTIWSIKNTWYGLTEEMLPDVISLTCFPENGEPITLPVRVR